MKRNGYSFSKTLFYLLLSVAVTHSGHSYGSAANTVGKQTDKMEPQKKMQGSVREALEELETRYNAFIIYNHY